MDTFVDLAVETATDYQNGVDLTESFKQRLVFISFNHTIIS